MTETITERSKTDFIRAVRANNYAHYEFDDGLVLITDITEDEEFSPFISVEEEELDEEDIADSLDEVDFIDFENVEIDEEPAINFKFCDIYDAEFQDPICQQTENPQE